MKTIAMMMISSNHIIPRGKMKYRKQDKCILTDRDNFITANVTLQPNDLDRYYIVYDELRRKFIRTGAAKN